MSITTINWYLLFNNLFTLLYFRFMIDEKSSKVSNVLMIEIFSTGSDQNVTANKEMISRRAVTALC